MAAAADLKFALSEIADGFRAGNRRRVQAELRFVRQLRPPDRARARRSSCSSRPTSSTCCGLARDGPRAGSRRALRASAASCCSRRAARRSSRTRSWQASRAALRRRPARAASPSPIPSTRPTAARAQRRCSTPGCGTSVAAAGWCWARTSAQAAQFAASGAAAGRHHSPIRSRWRRRCAARGSLRADRRETGTSRCASAWCCSRAPATTRAALLRLPAAAARRAPILDALRLRAAGRRRRRDGLDGALAVAAARCLDRR
ncbi:MAG: hypothetical protein MZW92_80045 [Comamonadaceae bacterium]|nr:hypothetical protein [Comamonadaceae bacterium]